ncbi:uncharacterized protein LOC103964689 isoform X1 [Pyrus x bretschneideri]|uniref:uncharacterized protein LOC103964689 isoform X1 n=1 Tax=Pyrus x bretschneideri TaxID=225117 RepID=UPI00202DCA84|nr:uncharacterized protein LOC103964689 isoform X1 [Pyrus x bretschneideri]
MKERSREMGSSRRTAEEIFRDYSGRRTDAVHDLTNETEVEQGFVHFDQLGLPPTFGKSSFSHSNDTIKIRRKIFSLCNFPQIPCRSLLSPMSSYSTVHVRKARAWFFGWGFQISRGREAVLRFNRAKPLSVNRGPVEA